MQVALLFLVVLLSLCKAQNDPATETTQWTTLTQSDFDGGTYRITDSGYYRLEEDIWFDAKAPSGDTDAYDSYTMDPSDFKSGGGEYPDLAYQVGFWAAITIETSGVTIDLNGKTIGQAKGHNLMNRYFNVIELASQPFVSGQGFANFGPVGNLAPDTLVPASFVTIMNGKIGRAASHGIHGTGNKNIYISQVVFENFETAGVSLYGVDTLIIEDCSAYVAASVPVNAHFNIALNLRPFINHMVKYAPDYALNVTGSLVTVSDIQSQLRDLINNVYDIVINREEQLHEAKDGGLSSDLFSNYFGRPDGNCWGFSTFSRNLDVDGYPFGFRDVDIPSRNVNITRTFVYDMECAPLEVIALTSSNVATVVGRRTIPLVDARGFVFAILQMKYSDSANSNNLNVTFLAVATDPEDPFNVSTSSYVGTPVTNGQAIIGKAIMEGIMNESLSTFNVRRSTFNKDILTWISAPAGSRYSQLSWYIRSGMPSRNQRQFICNGDESFRVQMGVAGFRLASTWNFYVSHSEVLGLRNFGGIGQPWCEYTNTTRSHPNAVLTGYGGAAVRGFAVASCRDSVLDDDYVRWIQSAWGSQTAFDILTDSQNIQIKDCEVRDGDAGREVDPELDILYSFTPTPWPTSIGFHVDQRATNVELLPYCVNALYAPFGDTFKTSVSESTTDGGEWAGCHRGDEPWWIWLILGFVCLVFILALFAIIMACMGGGGGDNTYQEMKNV